MYRQRPDLFTLEVPKDELQDGDEASCKSFHIYRPYSAPPSPTTSGRSSPQPPGSGTGQSTPKSPFDEEEVDEDTERLELGLQMVSVNANNSEGAA